MNLADIFSSPESLRLAFAQGLERQLEDESLGTFILVLANALFDEYIFNKFKDRLGARFEQMKQDCARNTRRGKPLQSSADDIQVFQQLIAMGFNKLFTTEYRHTENWELQFNQLRSLRPRRMSGEIISNLSETFDEAAFHFNKPFLDKEILCSDEINGVRVKLLYNKFPFATLHGLLVPEPEQNLPQCLKAEMHAFISSLSIELGKNIPNIAIAYNAYGAGASVNHLHFQTFTMKQPLPVLKPQWLHNGGSTPYPVSCKVFDNSDTTWQYINKLHLNNITYNLLYLPDKILCLPRQFQGNYKIPQWTENFAWYELCGGITTFRHIDFQKLEDEEISAALSNLKLSIP